MEFAQNGESRTRARLTENEALYAHSIACTHGVSHAHPYDYLVDVIEKQTNPTNPINPVSHLVQKAD